VARSPLISSFPFFFFLLFTGEGPPASAPDDLVHYIKRLARFLNIVCVQ
jgi:hypothetical protein